MILKELFRDRREVVALTENDRIFNAVELMLREKVGSVVIVDGRKVVGIITDRDIALGVALGAATSDSFVSEVMSRDVVTIDESMNLVEVTRYIRERGLKRFPVVNRDKDLVGIVSADDILAMLGREIFDTCSSLKPRLSHIA